MNFEKMVLSNFRTNMKYGLYLSNYYQPVLLTLRVHLDQLIEETSNGKYRVDRRSEQFNPVKVIETFFRAPMPMTYSLFTNLVITELSKQAKQIYGDSDELVLIEQMLGVFRSIYDGIERLPEDERMVIKILFTIRNEELTKKYFQFVNVNKCRESGLEKLRDILSVEEFRGLEYWLERVDSVGR